MMLSMFFVLLHVAVSVQAAYQPPSYDEFRTILGDLEGPAEKLDSATLLSDQEFLTELAPMLAARSVERVADFLKNDAIGLPQRLTLLDAVISDVSYGFSHVDAVQLVLDVANSYQAGSAEQEQVFGVLLKHPVLLKKTSPLFIAIAHEYSRTYIPLLAWSLKQAATQPAVQADLKELKMRALKYAVETGNAGVLQKIYDFAHGVTPDEATELVWHIAQTGDHPELLSLLVRYGADINQARGKATPLIDAVDKGRKAVVEQLIGLKVRLDALADTEYGTALQRAIANRDAVLEDILRKAGARE